MARKPSKKRRPIWSRRNPNAEHKSLTRRQKAKAKRAARRAGRTYPNAIDNINAAKDSKS
jgi:hypothetical protein